MGYRDTEAEEQRESKSDKWHAPNHAAFARARATRCAQRVEWIQAIAVRRVATAPRVAELGHVGLREDDGAGVHEGSAGVHREVAGALWALAGNPGNADNQMAIANAGGVAPLESSRLFVRYAFAGRVFEITVGEREELVLPSPKAREVGERYRHTFSNVRLVAHRQALQVLRAGAHPEDAVQPMGAWVAGSSGRSSSSSCSGGGSVRVGVGGGESKSGTYSSRDGALADINDMD